MKKKPASKRASKKSAVKPKPQKASAEFEELKYQLKIESALEKVRVRAMAMRHSSELAEVAAVLFKQISLLTKTPNRFNIGIANEKEKSFDIWLTDQKGHSVNQRFVGYAAKSPVIASMFQAWKSKKKLRIKDLHGDQLRDWIQYMHGELGIPFDMKRVKEHRYINSIFFSHGFMGTTTNEPIQPEVLQLLERFSKVFEQTYTRFLDLQHAEALAREAEIELALERVRARTMAMHKSQELAETSFVLFQQFKRLGEISDQLSIGIFKEEGNFMELYSTLHGEQWKEAAKIDLSEPVVMKKIYAAWKKKTNSLVIDLEAGQLKKYNTYREKLSSLKYKEKRWIIHVAFFSKGVLTFSTTSPSPRETIQLLERFAKVFNSTYTRFLDLQKAEAQAREAEIELALERIRARTMAMQHSNELQVVINRIFHEFESLGIRTDNSLIITNTEKAKAQRKGLNIWVTNKDHSYAQQVFTPYLEIPPQRKFYDALHSGQEFYTGLFSKAEKNKYFKYAFIHSPQLGALPDKRKKHILDGRGWVWSAAILNNVALCIQRYDRQSFEEEENKILKRFSAVLNQTYTRFLDLQKAEAQARESQIEASLERVRARTMAMHDSSEFGEVAAVLFDQISSLTYAPDRFQIAIVKEEDKSFDIWVTEQGGRKLSKAFVFRSHESPVVEEVFQTWKKKKKSLIQHLSGKNLIHWIKYVQQVAGIPFNKKQVAKDRYINSLFFSHGCIGITTHEPPDPALLQLIERFAKVFEQTYTRFLDLQKAEAQAREAEIELALERIRSQAMAMKTSSELLDIVVTMRNEFTRLGHEAHYFWHMMWLPDKYEKAMTSGDGTRIGMVMELPRHIHGDIKLLDDWEKSDQPVVVYPMNTKAAIKYVDKMVKLGNFKQVDPNAPSHDDIRHIGGLTFVMARTTRGEIGYSLPGVVANPPKEDLDLLVRFAGAFDIAHLRFLDLQKSETQAREVQIELALEKVRSRSMAMHNSEELSEVGNTVFHQLKMLGIRAETSWFWFIDQDNDEIEIWVTHKNKLAQSVKVKASDYQTFDREIKAWKRQVPFLKLSIPANEAVRSIKKIFGVAIKKEKGATEFNLLQTRHQYGFLGLGTWKEANDEEVKICIRFAKVFEQAYTRFLDLQKAEAQTREAQIEAALERVRSKTMAMHNSHDVGVTVVSLFDEVVKMGLDDSIRCGIGILEGKERMETWSVKATSDGDVDLKVGLLNMDIHPLLIGIKKAWKENKKTYSYELKGADVRKYYSALNKEPGYPFNADLEALPDREYNNIFFFSAGVLFAFTENQLTEDAKKVLSRFAGVFGQTYRRYLDLKKAEAQAREAKIEAALERVRAQAMAMHHTEDLSKTIQVYFEQLDDLIDSAIVRCGAGLLNKENTIAEMSTASKSPEGETYSVKGRIDMRGHPLLESTYEHWLHQKEHQYMLRGNEIREYYQYITGQVAIPENRGEDELHFYFPMFTEGSFYVVTSTEVPENELQIFRRFSSVLSLTYRRFNDLQKAEAQAKEAVKQSSLDRIRGEIASMRTTQDLDRITPLIWKELTTLNIPFIRCGVFIMDDALQQIHTFLSTPDGKAIAAFHLPYEAPGRTREIVGHWQNKQAYIEHWDEAAFSELSDLLVQQGALPSKDVYLKTVPGGGLYLHCLPFMQGMLYVGNTVKLSEVEIQLIQSVADAFSTAYARYEDFNKLEAAKATVEKTLTDLKQTQAQLVQSEKMASLGELTAGIAHEIQNPLNFVNNFSEVSNELLVELKEEIEKGNVDEVKAIAEDVIANLEKILHHGKRADGIVKGMLQHSRASSGQKELTDLNVLADEYLRLAFHGMRAKDKSFNAKFETDFNSSLPKIKVAPQDIGRVILNLITNAFYIVNERSKKDKNDYQPTVWVVTNINNDKVQISVKDNGTGMSEAVKEKIFQPFFTTKPTGQGTGLGLSLSYDIVKAHGGELKVESTEGEGCEFVVKLPIV